MQNSEDSLVESKSNAVPWTIQQTWYGIILTLIPWAILAVGLSQLGQSKAFLIAPLYIANKAFRSIIPHFRLALRALGFRDFDVRRSLVLVVILFIAILAIDHLYQYVITVLHLNLQTNDQVLLQRSKIAPITTYATLLAAVFVAPFCEEVFFRGFFFPGLRQSMPVGWAIVLSSFFFAVAHADPGSFAVLFIIGLALAFLRWRTNSIWPGMILHFINNGLGALLIVLAMQGIVKQ